MLVRDDIRRSRRQPYISQAAYEGTLNVFDEDHVILQQKLQARSGQPLHRSRVLRLCARHKWSAFLLEFTAGASLTDLAVELTTVVQAFETYVDETQQIADEDYYDPLVLDDLIDVYVEYISILCVAILLHREDLIKRIFSLIENTDFDGEDAIIEELLKFYLTDRPVVDEWFWDKPYGLLVAALDDPDVKGRMDKMRRYVSTWYVGMKGQAQFWGSHENIEEDFSPYYGYWAMCAAAFTYLYGIDDSTYRNEIVYPRDLVDYARSIPRAPVVSEEGSLILRVVGGQPCPQTGTWFSPAHAQSSKYFIAGDLMPVFESSEYGSTIWQWAPSA